MPSRAVISVMSTSMRDGARACAAIDGYRGAGNVLRVVGRQECDDRCHLFRLLCVAERLGFRAFLLELGPAILIAKALLGGLLQALERALGPDRARIDAEDADIGIRAHPA